MDTSKLVLDIKMRGCVQIEQEKLCCGILPFRKSIKDLSSEYGETEVSIDGLKNILL